MYQPIENFRSRSIGTPVQRRPLPPRKGIERLAAGFGEMRAAPRRTEPTEARALADYPEGVGSETKAPWRIGCAIDALAPVWTGRTGPPSWGIRAHRRIGAAKV